MSKEIKLEECRNKLVHFLEGPLIHKKGVISEGYKARNGFEFRFLKFPDFEDSQYQRLNPETPVEIIGWNSIEKRHLSRKNLTALLEHTSIKSFSLGTDPEVFVVDRNGTIIPAFNFLKAKNQGERVYWDGFQAEFTTESSDGYSCLAYLTDDVHEGLVELLRRAKAHNRHASLTWRSVLDIPRSVLREARPAHLALGCAPSMNIYPQTRPLDIDGSALDIRFAGCHLHFGIGKRTKEEIERAVKALDAIFGVLTVSLFQGMEDERRRRYYGRAGEFRLPAHGLEYRVPSSAMISHPAVWHLCFDMARAAMNLGLNEMACLWHANEEDVIETINSYDYTRAKEILKENEGMLGSLLCRIYDIDLSKVKVLLNVIYTGAIKNIPNIDDMEGNWRLNDGSWSTHSSSENCCVYKMSWENKKSIAEEWEEWGDNY